MNIWKDIPTEDEPSTFLNMACARYVVFPVEYGFVSRTWAADDDQLDVMVVSYEPLEVG